jgi:hypothetical protein
MPQIKASFARLQGFDPASFQTAATRLKKVRFDINSDMQVLAVDQDFPRMNIELAQRRQREQLTFDESDNKFTVAQGYEYRRHYFSFDAQSATLQTPGGKRDFALLVELLKKTGSAGVELQDLTVDLTSWTRTFLSTYDSAQLGQIVFDNFYSEPRLIGRYSAKTVDNRIEARLLEEVAASLRSIRLSFFHDGVRRMVEVRSDAVLAVTSSDEEDCEHYFDEQRRLLLAHTALVEREAARV